MIYAEILLSEDPNDEMEWLVIEKRDGYVAFRFDYISRIDGQRKTWCDTGASFDFDKLGAVREALERIAKDLEDA